MKAWVTGTALFVTCGSSFGGFQLKLCQNAEA